MNFRLLGVLTVLLFLPLVTAFDGWETGVSYGVGDVVTYDGVDYVCLQAHTSIVGWEPPNVPALWEVYLADFENGDTWISGAFYERGWIVEYEGVYYEVLQSHTSQSNWFPPNVPALFSVFLEEVDGKPVIKSNNITVEYSNPINYSINDVINGVNLTKKSDNNYRISVDSVNYNSLNDSATIKVEGAKFITPPTVYKLVPKMVTDTYTVYDNDTGTNQTFTETYEVMVKQEYAKPTYDSGTGFYSFVVDGFSTYDLTDDLVAYYEFEDDLTDVLGVSDLTGVSSPTYNTGKIGQAVYFDGTADYAYIDSLLDMSAQTAVTINFWQYADSSTPDLGGHGIGTRGDGATVLRTRTASNNMQIVAQKYGGNSAFIYSSSGWTGGSWEMWTGVFTNDNVTIFKNGVQTGTTTGTNLLSQMTGTYADTLFVGALRDLTATGSRTPNKFYKGRVDELGVWSTDLPPSAIEELYNSGSGLQYPFTLNFTVYANNTVTNLNLSNFNVTINGTTYESVNGSVITPITAYSPSLWNVTVDKSNYFSATYYDINVSVANFYANLTQAYLNYSCYEKITNNSLSCDESSTYPFNSGTYQIQANVTGYYPVTKNVTVNALDNKTVSFEGFANSYFYSTALDGGNSSSISGFTINITDIDNGWSEQLTASSTSLNQTLISGRNYSMTFSKSGYETKNVSLASFSSQSYVWTVYPANSVNITIRKESDFSLVTDEVTIQFVDSNESISSYTATTGYKYITGLTPENYTINFISSNYSTRTYNLVLDDDHKNIVVYLVASGSSNAVFTFQDKDDGSRLEGVTLSVLQLINTSWTLIESLSSDITGRTSFDYSSGVTYRFVATTENYEAKNWTLDPILFSSYVIKMDKNFDLEDNSDFNGVTVFFEPKRFVDGTNTTINFTFSNPSGEFVNYGFNATFDGVTYVNSSGITGIGSVLNATIEIVGAELNDLVTINFYYELSNGEYYSYTRNYVVSVNEGFREDLGQTYGLGLLERALIVVGLAILLAGAGAYYGGALAGGIMAMFIFGIFGYTGFLSWWLVLPSLIVMFIVGTWRSTT